MRIGELADRCGIPTRTIRFYERRGLMAEPARTPSGYRDYDIGGVQRLDFIRTAQTAGLTLREIKEITDLRDAGETPCLRATELIGAKLTAVREQRTELASLEEHLIALLERSEMLDHEECRPENICQILQPSADE